MIQLALRLSQGAPPRVRQALLAAMAVESNFRNVNYGDRDSLGVLQQRPSQGWGPPGNPSQDIQQFLARARQANAGFQGTPGQLAQSIQRSAFPDRYDKRMPQVLQLLNRATNLTPTPAMRASGAGPDLARLRLLRENLGQGPGALVRALQSAPRVPPGGPVSPSPGMGAGAGQMLGGGGFSPEELFYDPLGGFKHGKQTGAIGGHGSHLHVAEDNPAQMLAIIQLAKSLGLRVGENPWTTGAVVRSGHAPKSYHKRETPFRGRLMGRASDITGSPAALKKLYLALSRGFRR